MTISMTPDISLANESTKPLLHVPICASPAGEPEERLVLEVLRSGQLVNGPKIEQFESACAEMAGVEHAIAVVNGTASLELILEGLGIGPGDEVITTAFTFAATVSAIVRRGATARLVDINQDHTIDVDAVEAAIGPRTAAVLPVHLYGQPADLVRLNTICEKNGLALIEDAAQAHGAKALDKPVGGWGHGSFSFYATKTISCGEGGAVTTNDAALARRVRLLRNQGMEQRYRHEAVGTNLRMSEMHAAIGLPSLARLTEINSARRDNAMNLIDGLKDLDGLELPFERLGRSHVWHQFTVLVDERDRLAAKLLAAGVQTGIHYPLLVQEQPAYANHPKVNASSTPIAHRASRHCISLPVHNDLLPHQLNHIVTATRQALRSSR